MVKNNLKIFFRSAYTPNRILFTTIFVGIEETIFLLTYFQSLLEKTKSKKQIKWRKIDL